jgi:predicted ATP-binding protein involved in virulence
MLEVPRSEFDAKPSQSIRPQPEQSRVMTRARRTALWTYRLTSSALRRRSNEEIARDMVLDRPLRIASFAVWCCRVGTGCLLAQVITIFIMASVTANVKNAPFISSLFFLEFAWIPAFFCGLVFWIGGRIILGVSLDVRRATAYENISQNVSYRDVEKVRANRQNQERELFLRNLHDRFVLRSFRWNDVRVFEDGLYTFAPRINVLLGKNGYGKTLLLRTLAAVLQRETDPSGEIFPPEATKGCLTAEVTRNRQLESIVRDPLYFDDHCGKIPLLAIPDSRFINRSLRNVAASPTGSESLAETGARNYLTQEPYENIVVELLAQMAIEYVSKHGGFKRPIFQLIQDVVRQLTDDDLFTFARIEEKGRTSFEIYVYTAGNRDAPVLIQSASQGTFSVIAIFGLIYSFLKSLSEDEDRVFQTAGIVIIDEIDAHLHPSWQQKILGLLTSKFPNVQFIVSGHSPVLVSGCDRGEVAVLRRNRETDRFSIEILERDFLGATAAEVYQQIFEIEDADRLYLEYTVKAAIPGQERDRELTALASKTKLSEADEVRIAELEREKRLIGKAELVREQRLQRGVLEANVEDLEEQVDRLNREIKRLRAGKSTPEQVDL